MFARHLAAVIGQYVGPEDVGSEIDDLVLILSRSGAASAGGR